jgi:hypothetical protein
MSVFGGCCESKCNKRKQSENLLAGAPKFPLLRALRERNIGRTINTGTGNYILQIREPCFGYIFIIFGL